MNSDLFMLLISKDEEKYPTKVLNITPDIFGCQICTDWIGIEEDCVVHEKFHPAKGCHFCGRRLYSLNTDEQAENTWPICSVCNGNLEEFKKTFTYKWSSFVNNIKRSLKLWKDN